MYKMKESWTDARMDDFAKHVDQRFDAVDRRFDEVDRRLDKIDKRLDRIDDLLVSLQKAVINGFIGLAGSMVAGFVALIAVLATQL
jgi:DNA anti-recombination protein RmuC